MQVDVCSPNGLLPFRTWIRSRGERWRVIAEGWTFADSEEKAERCLQSADLTGRVETFTGRRGTAPPCVGDE